MVGTGSGGDLAPHSPGRKLRCCSTFFPQKGGRADASQVFERFSVELSYGCVEFQIAVETASRFEL
eukprot:4610696-Karenia_brevis.AAC.1